MLALPLLMLAVWAALIAVRRRELPWVFVSGLASGLAIGLKQNFVGSLVFALVLIAASAAAQRGPGSSRRFGALAAAVLAGLLVPVVASIGWARAGGIRLQTLWYTVVGLRSSASVILLGDTATDTRADTLALRALALGLLPVIAGFLVHLRAEWRRDGPLITAVTAMLGVDALGMVGGGQYWDHYLFPLVVPAVLCVAVLARRQSARGRAMRAVVVAVVVSSLACLWVWTYAADARELAATGTGDAIAGSAEPGDTLTVFGSHPHVQYASGLHPVYPYLWSMPMRVLDPELRELEALVRGEDAPEWLVQQIGFETLFDESGSRLMTAVKSRYVRAGYACQRYLVWLRADVERSGLDPDCRGR